MSQTIAQAAESFIKARWADGRAPRTIQDYHRVLIPFAEWCEECGITLTNLDRDVVREYVAYLRKRGWSESTVAIHVRNLRTFLRWLNDESFLEDNLARALKAPKRAIREEKPLLPEEIRALIDACQSGGNGRRDLALILCFLDTGLRLGEMALLRRDSVYFGDDSMAWIRAYAPKTRSYRFVFLGKASAAALFEYLSHREDSEDALWIGKFGKPLNASGIYKVVRRRARQAGIDRLHPHLLRKSFATCWLDNGGDVERLRVIAGWNSLDMLPVYVRSAVQDLHKAHQRAGPVDRLLDTS